MHKQAACAKRFTRLPIEVEVARLWVAHASGVLAIASSRSRTFLVGYDWSPGGRVLDEQAWQRVLLSPHLLLSWLPD